MVLLLLITAIVAGPFLQDKVKNIESYSAYILQPQIKYQLEASENEGNLGKVVYTPHISSFTGFAVDTEYITLALAFQNQDEDKKDLEESTLFDLQLAGAWNNFLWDIYYQNYIGLYITDKDKVDDDNLPKANSFSYGLGFKYFFRDNYHLKKSLANFSKNKETNWSWLWGSFYNRTRLFSQDNSLIPPEYENNFEQLQGLKAFEMQNIGLEFGISGMATYSQFYISSLFAINMVYQQQEFSGLDTDHREITSNGLSALLDFGYDWAHSAVGLDMQFQALNNPIKNAQFVQTRSQILVYYKYFF